MYGIELRVEEAMTTIKERGIPVNTCSYKRGTAVIKDAEGRIIEVCASRSAAVLVKDLAARFGPAELTLDQASEIVEALDVAS